MALSRSMKNLMHDAAQARRGGGNPTGGVMGRYNPGPKLQPRGPSGPTRGPRGPVMTGGGRPGRRTPETGGPGLPTPTGPAQRQALMKAKMQQAGQRGGGMGRPAVEPRPAAGGTFGFANQGGGGTPALQQTAAGSRMQAMRQAAAPRPAAKSPAGGASVRDRISARQGPPARAGGMARALGSGGSRRRMLR